MRPNEFEKRFANYNSNIEVEILSSVDEIVSLLKRKYHKTEVFIDWKVYDLAINKKSIDCNRALIKKLILKRRLTVYCNRDKSVMCLLYIDGRKRLTQIHLYAVSEGKKNGQNILALILRMYKEWKQRIYSEVICDPQNGFKFWFFVDERLVQNNENLRQFCHGFL